MCSNCIYIKFIFIILKLLYNYFKFKENKSFFIIYNYYNFIKLDKFILIQIKII